MPESYQQVVTSSMVPTRHTQHNYFLSCAVQRKAQEKQLLRGRIPIRETRTNFYLGREVKLRILFSPVTFLSDHSPLPSNVTTSHFPHFLLFIALLNNHTSINAWFNTAKF